MATCRAILSAEMKSNGSDVNKMECGSGTYSHYGFVFCQLLSNNEMNPLSLGICLQNWAGRTLRYHHNTFVNVLASVCNLRSAPFLFGFPETSIFV